MADVVEFEIWVVEHASHKHDDWHVWDSRKSFATPKEVLDRLDELTRENGKVLRFRARRYVPVEDLRTFTAEEIRDLLKTEKEDAGG